MDGVAAGPDVVLGPASARRYRGVQLAACVLAYLLVLAAWSAPSPYGEDSAPVAEQRIKAAFLYKFLSYVEWPASAPADDATPIVIGVMGADDVADDLRSIVAGRTFGPRPIEVRTLDPAQPFPATVRVLFVGQNDASLLERLVPQAQRRAILLVTDFDDGLDRGSVINLVVRDNHVRFEVSLDAAQRSRLRLSSRMLAVAVAVRPPT
jgi:hypothetical protein